MPAIFVVVWERAMPAIFCVGASLACAPGSCARGTL